MRDGLERYLEDVLCRANLARADERRVEAELRDHLRALANAAPQNNQKEIYAMLEQEFGNPKSVGSAIARAKGRVRTFVKRQWRPIPIGVALVLFFAVRWAVAAPFYVPSDAASPQIPRGSRVLVYKLARTYTPGDVIVFLSSDSEYRIAIVKSALAGGLLVQKHGLEDFVVPLDQVVGRVICNTR